MQLDLDGWSVGPLREPDLARFVAYRRDPAVARYQSWSPDYDLTDARALLDAQDGWDFPPPGEWMQFGIRGPDGLVGDVAVHPLADQPDTYEFGVTLDPAAQGRGIGVVVVTAVIDELFTNRGAHRVLAQCDQRNASVKRLFARVGLRHEGTAVDADWFKDEWTSVETWAVLARERSR